MAENATQAPAEAQVREMVAYLACLPVAGRNCLRKKIPIWYINKPMDEQHEPVKPRSCSLALIGSGGAGVMTAGQTLLDAASAAGYFGLMTRSTGPQIRGGEAAAILRLGVEPVHCQDDRVDLLVALDWGKAERFADELVLDAHSLVVMDPDEGAPPEWVVASGARRVEAPFGAIAKAHAGARVNTVAVGLIAALLALDAEATSRTVCSLFARKGSRLVDGARAGLAAGFAAAAGLECPCMLATPAPRLRWLVTGNEAVGMGALRGGVRFCAAYPITPSTEMQEWLAANLPRVGGCLVQAEDELASINMCIGASFGGVPAMTATSGPGFSLMVEALGLAVATETPVVVVDVMRGGPSTGIPTKSEQADLNIAVNGLHGDAPHLVLAPNGIGDCLTTTQWAVHLAEALQCPAVVLSDQLMGQARAAIEPPSRHAWLAARRSTGAGGSSYQRYADLPDGVSPVAIPGTPGGEYTATGLTHMASARPSAMVADHHRQLDKRRRKLERFDYGEHWADIEGDGPLGLITWGSTTQAAREAAARLRAEGVAVRLVSLRLLSPLDPVRIDGALEGVERLLVAEQSHGAQFLHHLRAHCELPAHTRSLAEAGPLPLRPGRIAAALRVLNMEQAA
jgi:2-oxoglutarate/2-oxoacid ferredoxin oxidoreductase subunit alpha